MPDGNDAAYSKHDSRGRRPSRAGRDCPPRSHRSASREGARHNREVRAPDEQDRDSDGAKGDLEGSIASWFSSMEINPQSPGSRRKALRDRSRSRSRSSNMDHRQGVRAGEAHRSFEDRVARRPVDVERASGCVGEEANGIESAKGMEPAVRGCGIMTTATFLKLATFLVMAFYGADVWAGNYHPSSGKLCTSRDICITSVLSIVCLTVAKMSAGALFPCIICCMLSKCYTTRYFLHHSWLSLVVSFEPAHELHTYFGSLTVVFGVLHGVAHIARLVNEGQTDAIIKDQMDRSGLVALLLLLPIGLPMMLLCFKKLMTFEFRKALHMLFIPFAVALCFHTKVLSVVCGILLVWYIADRLYFTTRMNFLIDRPVYRPVGTGTFVRFDLPPGYQMKVGSFIQVNCPAISVKEWHPFSVFPVPGSRPRAGFHAEAVGDWTRELFRLSLEDPRMPIWITAAQPSVLEKSIYFDNVLLVCTGAGITPAVCLADMFAERKNVHLLWLSREAGMVAMFEKQLRRVKSTVHVTGTPSAKTKQRLVDLLAPSKAEIVTNVSACSSRVPSFSNLTDLEAGNGGGVRPSSYRGELRDQFDWTGGERSKLVRNSEGSSSHRPRSSSASGGGVRSGRRKRRTPYGRPIQLHFGRPDVEKFITETVQGTVQNVEWAVAPSEAGAFLGGGLLSQQQKQRSSRRPIEREELGEGPLPKRESLSRQMMARLTSSQRISKKDLMSADLSVIAATAKRANTTVENTPNTSTASLEGGSGTASSDPWLVLYSGANPKVEKAVASACDGLGVAWRREYFSAW